MEQYNVGDGLIVFVGLLCWLDDKKDSEVQDADLNKVAQCVLRTNSSSFLNKTLLNIGPIESDLNRIITKLRLDKRRDIPIIDDVMSASERLHLPPPPPHSSSSSSSSQSLPPPPPPTSLPQESDRTRMYLEKLRKCVDKVNEIIKDLKEEDLKSSPTKPFTQKATRRTMQDKLHELSVTQDNVAKIRAQYTKSLIKDGFTDDYAKKKAFKILDDIEDINYEAFEEQLHQSVDDDSIENCSTKRPSGWHDDMKFAYGTNSGFTINKSDDGIVLIAGTPGAIKDLDDFLSSGPPNIYAMVTRTLGGLGTITLKEIETIAKNKSLVDCTYWIFIRVPG